MEDEGLFRPVSCDSVMSIALKSRDASTACGQLEPIGNVLSLNVIFRFNYSTIALFTIFLAYLCTVTQYENTLTGLRMNI